MLQEKIVRKPLSAEQKAENKLNREAAKRAKLLAE